MPTDAIVGQPSANRTPRVIAAIIMVGPVQTTFCAPRGGAGNIIALKLALAAGADVHVHDDTAIHQVTANGHADVVCALLDAVIIPTEDDQSLHLAATNGHVEIVRMLLAAGAAANAKEGRVLSRAADNGYTEIVRIVIVAGANVHARGDAALMWAIGNELSALVSWKRSVLAGG